MNSTPAVDKATVPLFRDGEEFFPRLFRAIKNAKHEVIVETYELGEDRVGYDLLTAMRLAIRRGARVFFTIDGWGSQDISAEFRQKFIDAGVHLQIFEPLHSSPLGSLRAYGRLHRKIAVIDGHVGFIGGINLRHCHMLENEEGKRDVAAEIVGPKVQELRSLCLSHLPEDRRGDVHEPASQTKDEGKEVTATSATMRFLFRNNRDNDRMIEDAWIDLIDSAERTLILAVAYFFPGENVCRALINAQKRGVNVCIIIQANPDQIMVHSAAQSLYNDFLECGISVVEYRERPLHAKVIEVDGKYAIIGSSNLDPWSLHLNLEASVIVEDGRFAHDLRNFLQDLIDVSVKVETNDDLIDYVTVYPTRGVMKQFFSGISAMIKSISVRDPIIVSLEKNTSPKTYRLKGESAKRKRPFKWLERLPKKSAKSEFQNHARN